MKMTQHYDLGIVGWWYGDNYGSMLTYYALYSILTDLGYSVAMIPRGSAPDAELALPDTPPVRFANQMYNVTARRPASAMFELNDLFDGFVCGSDQLWNPTIPIVDSENFLAFAADDKRLVSYATSFGSSVIDSRWQKPVIIRNIQNLRRFDYVSVREDYGIEIARQVFGVDAVAVLDPVFLAKRSLFDTLADSATYTVDGDYLFAFILDPTPEKRQSVEAVAQKLGLESVVVMTGADSRTLQICQEIFTGHQVVDAIDVCVFLRLLRESAYVVTDSFHGTCFSWIYRRPFSSIVNEKRGADRFRYLFQLLDLKERELQPGVSVEDTIENADVSLYPDFSRAEQEVTLAANKSRDWLTSALETPIRTRGTELLQTENLLDVRSPITFIKLESDWQMSVGTGSVILDMTSHKQGLRDQCWRILLDEPLKGGHKYTIEISLNVLEGTAESIIVIWSNSSTGEETPVQLESLRSTKPFSAPFDGIDSLLIRVLKSPDERVRISVEKVKITKV